MEQAISGIQKLIWLIFKVFYTLATPILFIVATIVLIKYVDVALLPKPLNNIITFFTSIKTEYKYFIFSTLAITLGLIIEAASNVLTFDEKTKADEAKAPSADLTAINNICVDGDLKIANVGHSHISAIKAMNEYENFNSYTSFLEAKETIVSGVIVCLGVVLTLYLPVIYLVQFSVLSNWYLLLCLFQFVILSAGFLIAKKALKKSTLESESPNWNDKMIKEPKDLGLLIFIEPVCGLLLLFFFWNSFAKNEWFGVIFNLSITLLAFPLYFILVVWKVNIRERIRKLLKSAFIHMRYDDIIFRNNNGLKSTTTSKENENRN